MLPDFQTIMLPYLESLKEGEEQTIEQLYGVLAAYFELTDAELHQRLPGSDQTEFYQSIHLAKSHLLMADLISTTSQDVYKIAPLGKQVLHRRLNMIDIEYLRRFPGYIEAARDFNFII